MQLNIAQGKVRCAQCHTVFDAFAHFVLDPAYEPSIHPEKHLNFSIHNNTQNIETNPVDATAIRSENHAIIQHVMQMMGNGVDGSKLNLYTYLNHLDTMSPNQTGHTPLLPISNLLDEKDAEMAYTSTYTKAATGQFRKKASPNQRNYYFTWGIINFLLVLLLIFQFFFFSYV